MSQRLVLDNAQFAERGMEIHGELDASQLLRLADGLAPGSACTLRYCLRGGRGGRRELLLFLRIEGSLELTCQRCLRALNFDLEVDAIFELRESLADDVLVQDDLEDDSRDFLAVDRSMDLVILIEDEALLALPAVPKHESCDAVQTRHVPEVASPFGVLLKIKGQSGTTH